MMGTVAQTVHQAAVSVQETDCCPKRGDVVCAMSVRVTREFGVDPPVLCSGMDVRLKWWSVEDETLKDPNPLNPPPPHSTPTPPFPCTSPTMCVLDSAHERIRAAFFLPLSPFTTLHYPLCLTFSIHCPPSPPYIIHSVSLSPSTVPLHHLTLSTLSYCLHPLPPFHHLTLSTLSYCLHPLSPFTTLHYPLCLTVSIHCPPSPPYIIHSVLLSPSTVPFHHLTLSTLSYCLHPLSPLHHLTLSTLSYCLHLLSPFTTLHYPLLGCAGSSCSCFFCSLFLSVHFFCIFFKLVMLLYFN